MSRVPLVDPDDDGLDPEVAAALRHGAEFHGLPHAGASNLLRAMANHPKALTGMGSLARNVYLEGTVSPVHRELAYLGASVANSCHY